jgi:hypothetical protein
MTNYTAIVAQIESAKSLAEISQAVSSYSASAVGSGGILYSGGVGTAHDRQRQGTTVIAEIETGRRRAISCLLSPSARCAGEGLRER